MKTNNNEMLNNEVVVAPVAENVNAVDAPVAPVVENEANETKPKKDATPLEIIRQQYAADKKGFMKQAIKNPYSETSVMKGNFTMKKSEIMAYLPKTASFECLKKHHFNITFAEGVVFNMNPQGMEYIGNAEIDEATKKSVVKFARNFYTENVIDAMFA